MLDIIKYILVYIVFGFIPIFLILFIKKTKIFFNLIFSIAFAPVLIAFLNIFNIILGIEGTFLQYIIPFVLLFVVVLSSSFWEKFYSADEIREALTPIITGTFFGIIYWYLFFYQFYIEGAIYTDVMWNFGFLTELKDHFPPVDPHWSTNGYFLYHYLNNMGFAGISNFAGLNVIQTVLKSGNLINSISIFIILALSIRNRIVESFILFIIIIFFPFTPGWMVFLSLGSHMSGYAASSFFWSLPILLASVYTIYYLNKDRLNDGLFAKTIIFNFIIVLATGFSKISNLIILIGIEFGYFIVFLKSHRVFNVTQIRKFMRPLLSFTIVPLFSLMVILLFTFKGNGGLFLGIEIKDFLIFDSWNPIYPFVAIYGTIIIFIFFNLTELSQFKWEYLICGFINLIFFFLTKHAGSSDLYFAFNAVLCNFLFLSYSSVKEKLKLFVYSYALGGLIVIIFSNWGYFKGFTPFEFSLSSISKPHPGLYNIRTSEVDEYLRFSELIPKDALIAAPKQDLENTFLYSAFIGRRIWNENPRYSPSVFNDYTLTSEFMKKQGFFPSFLKKKLNLVDYNQAFSQFASKIRPDQFNYLEMWENRNTIYKRCVFENIHVNEYENIVKNNKWTHIIVKESEIQDINSWLKSKARLSGKFITIFIVST